MSLKMAVYREDNAKALQYAIESILNQKFKDDVESRIYLAIDGPIPNKINEVIKKLEDRIFRIHRINTNAGLATALNSLIHLLEDEEFVFRMDADDLSYSDRFQTQLDYLRYNSSIDILGTDIIEVDAVDGSRRLVTFCRGPQDAIDKIAKRVPVAHPTVCFRRRVLDRIGGYPTAGTNEDVALWFRCIHEGFLFDNIREPLLEFSIGPGFWKRRSYKKAASELKCYLNGIWAIERFSWKYVYPIARFGLRIAPTRISRWLYKTKIRQ